MALESQQSNAQTLPRSGPGPWREDVPGLHAASVRLLLADDQ